MRTGMDSFYDSWISMVQFINGLLILSMDVVLHNCKIVLDDLKFLRIED